jgi:endo-1,4-beta-xylanase
MRLYIFFFTALLFSFFTTASGQETLRKYADPLKLNIGVAIGFQFSINNQTHNNLVKTEFNTVVPENSMKALNIHPSKGKTNFSGPDKLVKFAQDNNMKIRGHTLIWHRQNASWIITGSRQQVLENMKYHIETVMGHFKGKIFQWDVVNEALEDNGPNLRNSAYKSTVGADYIDSAFVFAHRTDPDCKLFYNDYGTSIINSKSDAVYNMVKKMLANGIPIHGVGFQSHHLASDGTAALYAAVKKNFQRFADLGLEIAITELDAPGSDAAAQAVVYSTYMKIALEMPAVTTYMIWGVRDQDSWVSPTPLIFDNNFKPKLAYTAVMKVLKNPQIDIENFSASLANWLLFYNSATNSLSFSAIRSGESRTISFFNLAGKKTASCLAASNTSVSLSSIKVSAGTMIVKANNQTEKLVIFR